MGQLPQFLAGVGSGVAGGLLSGAFGVGGGIVLVPLLGLALGLDQHRAQGVTLAAMLLPNGLPAVLHYRRRGVPIHGPLLAAMLAAFLPGILAGAWIANRIPPQPLRWGFAAFLLLLAAGMQRSHAAAATGPAPTGNRLRWGLAAGALGGLSAGLLGIGGGVVIIPLLVWGLRMPQQEAQLQSLALLLPPLGLPGALVYASAQGGLPWVLLAGVALGFMLGAWLGARAGTAVSGPALRRGFAVLMAATAALLVWKG